MSQADNPYSVAPGRVDDHSVDSDTIAGNAETQQLLKQTRPWVLTMGIVLILIGVLVVIGGLAMIAFSFVAASNAPGGAEVGIIGGAAVLYFAMGVLYFVAATYLVKFAKYISDYVYHPTHDNLNAALGTQKSFWKFVVITFIVTIAVYMLCFVGLMAFGFAARI